MREKGQTEVAKTLETPVFSRGIEILTEKIEFENYHPELPLRKAAENLGVSLNTVEKRKEIING